MKVRFLLDENLPPKLKLAVQRYNPDIDIIRGKMLNWQKLLRFSLCFGCH